MSGAAEIVLDGTALDLVQVSKGQFSAPMPDRAVFTARAIGFKDAHGNYFVREPLSGEVFRASLVGTTLIKLGAATARDDLTARVAALEQTVERMAAALVFTLGRDIRTEL